MNWQALIRKNAQQRRQRRGEQHTEAGQQGPRGDRQHQVDREQLAERHIGRHPDRGKPLERGGEFVVPRRHRREAVDAIRVGDGDTDADHLRATRFDRDAGEYASSLISDNAGDATTKRLSASARTDERQDSDRKDTGSPSSHRTPHCCGRLAAGSLEVVVEAAVAPL